VHELQRPTELYLLTVLGAILREQFERKRFAQLEGAYGSFRCGFTAHTNALMNLPSTCGAIASTSMCWPERNSASILYAITLVGSISIFSMDELYVRLLDPV